MTVTEHIRKHILIGCGVERDERYDLENLKRSEWSDEFERYMRNRLLMGAFRYTLLADANTDGWDTIGSIIKRAEKYRRDGNQEHLVDIANLALVEFKRPACHPSPHFSPQDDAEHTAPQGSAMTASVEMPTVVLLRRARSVIDGLMGDSDLEDDDSPEMQLMKDLSVFLDASEAPTATAHGEDDDR